MHAITLASYGWTGVLTTEVSWVFALMPTVQDQILVCPRSGGARRRIPTR
jgi:hypothetical protein